MADIPEHPLISIDAGVLIGKPVIRGARLSNSSSV